MIDFRGANLLHKAPLKPRLWERSWLGQTRELSLAMEQTRLWPGFLPILVNVWGHRSVLG